MRNGTNGRSQSASRAVRGLDRSWGRRVLSRLAGAAGSAAGLRSWRPARGAAVLAALLAAGTGTDVMAGPEGQVVVIGNVTFTRQGNVWVITASNGAIINYASFDILPYETVRFIQPSQLSTVLNRINSAAPTRIDGTLQANGQVFFVNPAGIIFGAGAVVNVGGIYAAAGQISNADFSAGRMNFTNNTGSVINNGQIHADTTVAMIGRHAANFGTIAAPQGTVVMAAGKDVYIGKEGSRVYARIQGDGNTGGGAGVENHGTIDARGGRVLMAAGDSYGMAIFNTGDVTARHIDIDGGSQGEVRIQGGKLDASDQAAGAVGGEIRVVGEKVGLFGTTLDASGDAGGGTIHIGGGREGSGDRNTDYVYIDQDTQVIADAMNRGNGGEIVVFGEQSARIHGRLYARGGVEQGAGGFIETSGGYLYVGGVPDMRARDGSRAGGHWLIDPFNVRIVAGAGTGDFGDPNSPYDNPGVNDSTLGVDAIVGALALGDVTVSTGAGGAQAGNITFEVNLDYSTIGVTPRTLTLNAANNVTFFSGVSVSGSAGRQLSLVLNADSDNDGSGSVDIANANFTLRGGSFQVTANAEDFTSASGGLIDTGGGAISLANTGVTTIGGSISTGGGTLTVGGSSITTSGAVTTSGGNINFTSAGDITIGALFNAGAGSASVTSTAGNVILNSTVTATGGVTATAANDLTVGGNINAGTSAVILTAGSDGTGDMTVGVGTPVTLTGSSVDLIAGTGAGGTITFGQTTTFTATGPVTVNAGTGTIVVNAALDFGAAAATLRADELTLAANLSGTGSLTIRTDTAGNNIQLGGGGATGALDLTSAEIVFIQDGFSGITLGDASMTGAIDVNGNVSFLDTLTFLTAGGGQTSLNADVTTTGDLIFSSNVTLANNSAVSGANITFGGTVGGAFGLTANSQGATTFNGTVSGLTGITTDAGGTTAINADITTSGTQTYNDDVTLTGATRVLDAGAGDLVFAGTLTGAGTDLTLNSTGNDQLGGAVTLNSLTTNAGGTTTIAGGAVTTTAGQTYHDDVVITAATTLTGVSIAFDVTLNSGGAAQDLIISDTGTTVFNGAVGGTLALNSISFLGGGTQQVCTDFTTVGAQTWGALVLCGDVIFASTGNAAITFTSTVQSNGVAHAMTVNTTGATVFAGVVGGGGAGLELASLTTDAGGTTSLAADVTTTGNQTYNDNVVLAGSLTLTGVDVTFAGLLDADDDANNRALTVAATGNTWFKQNVGTEALASITTSGGGLTIFGDAAGAPVTITTTGLQSYGDDVELRNDTTIAAGNATFGGAVNADAAANNRALVVNTSNSGVTQFNGAVGGLPGQELGSLTTNADGTTELAANISTTGAITFNDAVTLFNNVTMNSTGNADISFLSTVDSDLSARDLTITSTGNAIFAAAVGGGSALNNLTVAGNANINGGAVTTEGTQTYQSTVAIGANTVLTAGEVDFLGNVTGTGFSLTFLSQIAANGITVGGAEGVTADLQLSTADIAFLQDGFTTINFGNGTFAGPITIIGPVAFLDALRFTVDGNAGGVINLGGSVSVTDATNDASIQFAGPVTLTADSTVISAGTTGTNGDILFGGTVDGAFSLTVNTIGEGRFSGLVGAGTALTDLITDAQGTTRIDAGVKTTNSQVYNDNLVVGGDVTLENTAGAGISIQGNVNGIAAGTESLTITDGGAATTFGAGTNFGNTFQLLNFTMNGTAAATIGFDIATAGFQNFTNAVTLTGNRTFTGTSISFTGGLNASAAGQTLTITASDDVNLGAVGTGTAFDVMRVTAGTDAGDEITLTGDVTATAFQEWVGQVRLNTALVTMTSGQFLFRGDIDATTAGVENLTLIATTPTGASAIPIMVTGSFGSGVRLGTLTLGSALGATPEYSTIVFAKAFGDVDGNAATFDLLPTAAGVNTGDSFSIIANDINIEANQKVLALGNLTMNATNGITVGDLNALGDLSLTATTLTIRMRNGASVRDRLGVLVGDIGTDWTAGGTLTTNATTINTTGAGGTFSFSYGSGGADAGLTAFGAPSRQVVILETIFSNAGNNAFLLGLDLTSQTTTDQPPIAGINPGIEIKAVATPEPLSGELSEFLLALGVNVTKEADFGLVLDWLVGRALYDDIANPDPTAVPRYRVTRERLSLEIVLPLKETYDEIFRRPKLDANGVQEVAEDGRPLFESNERAVSAAMGKAWDRYTDKDTTPSGREFREFLESTGESGVQVSQDALTVLNKVKRMNGLLDRMGLSAFETRGPKNVLVTKATPSAEDCNNTRPTPEQMRDAVMGTDSSDELQAMAVGR